jgi:circadian clock protein KaiC
MQFMVDAVVVLQHRLAERVSLRALRVVKYRGSSFAEGEFPLVISPTGIEVSTFGHTELVYDASTERVSTGVSRLDTMLDGGYYRGSGILISGAPGTAKTTLAGAFVDAACKRGERALYVSFDESASQIMRNLRSVGIDLEPHVESGLLDMYSIRTEARSAEGHLIDLKCRMESNRPQHLVLDPISALAKTGGQVSAVHTSLRLLDLAKANGITVLSTSLVASDDAMTETTSMQISTIADTWLHLSYLIHGGERNRALTIVKSRGMKHSNQVRELLLSNRGLTLAEVYTAGGEVLVGTARWEKEMEVRESERRARAEAKQQRAELEVAQAEILSRIEVLQRQLEASRAASEVLDSVESARERQRHDDEVTLGKLRGADAPVPQETPGIDVPRPRDRARVAGDD